MIAYLKGIVAIKKQEYIVIDVGGIGYKVFMPENEIEEIKIESDIKVHTYLRVREDDVSIYGFLGMEELAMFELLIGVGGIGAKSAVSILSNIAPSKFALAVISDDVNTLKKLPGIGAKTAQRIILELKDKIKTEEAVSESKEDSKPIKLDESVNDAIEALQVLGYSRKDIENELSKINTKDMTTEDIIKIGLKNLGR